MTTTGIPDPWAKGFCVCATPQCWLEALFYQGMTAPLSLADSPISATVTPSSSSGMAQTHSYSSSPLSLFRLQEQFRQHMAATNNLVHYSSFEMGTPSAMPYLGMNVNMAPLSSLHCQSYYQSLSHAQQVWSSPILQASSSLPSLNSKTTSIENLRLRAKQHAASLGLDTLPN